MHGYGKVTQPGELISEGLFEEGTLKGKNEISEFESGIDFIAKKVHFEYLLYKQE